MKKTYYSASQVTTFLSCNRKWALQYLLGLKPAETGSTSLGSEVHKILEEYVKEGKPIDLTCHQGRIAQSMIEQVPAYHDPTGYKTEGYFTVQGKHWWRGYKDLEKDAVVYDYKTTSDFRWAKTEDDLKYDPQAILYAKSNGAPEVELNWVYGVTRGANKSKVVRLKVLKEHADEVFQELENIADDIEQVRKGAEGLDKDLDREKLHNYVMSVDCNPDHCEAYGGCSFRGVCNLSPTDIIFASFKDKKPMSLFERLKAKNAVEAKETVSESVELENSEVAASPAPPASPVPVAPAINPPESADVKPADFMVKSKRAPKAPAAEAGFTLYLDCVPMHRSGATTVTTFEDIVIKAKALIHEEFQLADYRFAEFGRGPGMLQQAVVSVLERQKDRLSVLVADTRMPETVICLAELKNRAATYVVSTK